MNDTEGIAAEIRELMGRTSGVSGLPPEQLSAVADGLAGFVLMMASESTDVVVGWSWGPTWHGTLTMHCIGILRGVPVPDAFRGIPGAFAVYALADGSGVVKRTVSSLPS